MKASPRSYSTEFKKEAALLVVEEGYSISEASRNLGVSPKNISRWKKAYESSCFDQQTSLSSSEKEELTRLRQENKRLKMERDILKKAAVFFAKEGE